tara:strand:+ start:1874 stop:2113 length:240 start_codon:yes stop_codon:yes gene_type:complete
LIIDRVEPTLHYALNHANVEWELVLLTVLSPTKIKPNKRYGKDRLTFIRTMKNQIIEVHAKKDPMNTIWVINAFKNEKW